MSGTSFQAAKEFGQKALYLLRQYAPEFRKALDEGLTRLENAMDKTGAGTHIGTEIGKALAPEGGLDGKGESNLMKGLSQDMANGNYAGALYKSARVIWNAHKEHAASAGMQVSPRILTPLLQPSSQDMQPQKGSPSAVIPNYTALVSFDKQLLDIAMAIGAQPERTAIPLIDEAIKSIPDAQRNQIFAGLKALQEEAAKKAGQGLGGLLTPDSNHNGVLHSTTKPSL